MRTILESDDGAAVQLCADQPIELTIVIPTFNERGNIIELLRRIEAVLRDVVWEAIIVDDNSPDGTAELARQTARYDRRVRCIKRIGRRGLSSASIEGIMASAAPYVAVMDADLQHDERILPVMLPALRSAEVPLRVIIELCGDIDLAEADIERVRIRLQTSVEWMQRRYVDFEGKVELQVAERQFN